MSDPLPDAVDQKLPANAEDRKAAAALSSLNTNEIGTDSASKPLPAAEQEALGKAMSRLEIAAGTGSAAKRTNDAQKKQTEMVKKKAVKVAAEDVTLLVDELELSKVKATELLKSHDGDAKKAIKTFVTPAVGA
ncbi:hypothetical protein EYZ11_005366 [Aspergillus tanneri]|uniref:Nascent polypeptide-associated complex subunit alpha-like UBA domain-containing protein n=1 Tax=Aspergillus tanneri TaxID=1220188 RepID=A0A4S3JID5_9EURO|nr:uncharacterized protein ATNIH1004_004853 [Aspergillus tanneri]KAA8648963.1 hypothetical protein ATNIH1004_004853 [Aspergillus tanneri]THC95163.1 hypothetical protein EYZ11_005366 [Aspergillus tanneri]